MVKKLKTKQNKKKRKRSHIFDIKAIKKAIKNELYTQYMLPETGTLTIKQKKETQYYQKMNLKYIIINTDNT